VARPMPEVGPVTIKALESIDFFIKTSVG